jgi:hypothetical protein
MKPRHLYAAAALCALLAGCASLLGPPNYPADLLGTPAPALAAQRTIFIRPDTRFANVTGGEIVRFVYGEREFAWSFDGPAYTLDLQQVAPPGFIERSFTVYIAPNPLYRRERQRW